MHMNISIVPCHPDLAYCFNDKTMINMSKAGVNNKNYEMCN